MKHYLLNHQPQKGLQTACAQQGQAPTCNARGKGRTPASPKTLTKIILVLLTMILLPSAAWGQDITIAGIEPNGDGKFINGTTSEQISGVLYNSESNTLTLTNAIIAGQIVWSKANATLIIEINGSNNVISNTEGSVIKTTIPNNTYEVNFKKGSVVEDSKTLILRKGGSGPTIEGFDYDDANQKGIGLYQIKANDGFAITTKAYELQIGINGKMTWVHNLPEYTNIGYKNDIFGEGQYQAVFDDVNKKLTLNNATINSTSSDALISGLDKLTIDLVGSNSITAAGNYYAISGFNSSTYMVGSTGEKFEIEISTSTTTGQLTLTRGSDHGLTNNVNVSYKRVAPTFSSPTGATSLETASVAFIAIKQYNLTVAGVPVTSANCEDILDGNNAGKVSFKPAIYSQKPTPAYLTLKGVNIEGRITWSDPEEGKLSIIIDGDNAITNFEGALISFEGTSQPQLSFSKAEGSGAKTLVLQSNEFPISGFDISSSSTIGDGLKAVSGQTYMGITTKDVYDLWIDGTQVHDIPELPGYKGNILGGTTATVTFDDGSQTLTLNNAEISSTSSTNAIETGLSTLNIDLKGNNSITTDGGYALYGNGGTRTIIFTSSSDPVGNLTLKNSSGELAKFVIIQYDTNTGLDRTIITPSDASDLAAAKEAIIAKGTAMGITVAGVVVTSENQTDILGDGKVSFSPAEVVSDQPSTGSDTHATLTLDDGATIEGNIQSSISPLIVHLKGSSTINPSTTNDAPFEYTGDTSSGSPALTFYSTDDEAGDLTMGGTLRKDNSGSNVTLTIGGYSVTNQFDDGAGTNLTGEWIYDSTSGEHHIFRNKLYGLWVGSYQVTRANKSSISSGYPTFDEDNLALRLKEKYTGLTIKSAMPVLKLFVKGECSLKNIIFDTTYNPDSEAGKLIIEKDPDSNDPATNNSLSLPNTDGGVITGGVITGFSEVTIEAPLHVLEPFGQSVWDSSVTSAEISDWTWSGVERIFEGNNTYATYYNPEVDMYLPSGYTPYVITGVSGSSVTTQALSYIPQGAMVLIAKSENTATTAVTTGNMLKYADSNNPVTATETSNYYVLYNGKFVKVTRGTTIGGPDSSGCYLDLSGVTVAGTRGFYDIDGGDGTTAIKDVKSEGVKGEKWADDGWHDLQGRRLSAKPTKPGLYILNGKKVVIK